MRTWKLVSNFYRYAKLDKNCSTILMWVRANIIGIKRIIAINYARCNTKIYAHFNICTRKSYRRLHFLGTAFKLSFSFEKENNLICIWHFVTVIKGFTLSPSKTVCTTYFTWKHLLHLEYLNIWIWNLNLNRTELFKTLMTHIKYFK